MAVVIVAVDGVVFSNLCSSLEGEEGRRGERKTQKVHGDVSEGRMENGKMRGRVNKDKRSWFVYIQGLMYLCFRTGTLVPSPAIEPFGLFSFF